ncbi:MAG: SMC-Scp complex subunit ScpB [Thomasclavelia sp.]|uniref:SMC-Scp complex subunit ScpB n=1 Tax=Thomasclavelia sp. TaxID=3025757 RepID=UPI0039A1488C
MEETSCLDEKINYLDIIEGMLYLAGDDGIDIKQVAGVLEISRKDATLLMDQFTQMYENKDMKGIILVNFGGRYKLATNSEYFIYYQKMVEQSSASLSNAALETLAIIAYNQPITRASIEDIRGVGCDAMIRKLVAKALIKEVGREDSPGMPILYGVTDEFMDTFGLTSLDELPDLADIVEVDDQEDIFATRYREDTGEIKEESNESH